MGQNQQKQSNEDQDTQYIKFQQGVCSKPIFSHRRTFESKKYNDLLNNGYENVESDSHKVSNKKLPRAMEFNQYYQDNNFDLENLDISEGFENPLNVNCSGNQIPNSIEWQLEEFEDQSEHDKNYEQIKQIILNASSCIESSVLQRLDEKHQQRLLQTFTFLVYEELKNLMANKNDHEINLMNFLQEQFLIYNRMLQQMIFQLEEQIKLEMLQKVQSDLKKIGLDQIRHTDTMTSLLSKVQTEGQIKLAQIDDLSNQLTSYKNHDKNESDDAYVQRLKNLANAILLENQQHHQNQKKDLFNEKSMLGKPNNELIENQSQYPFENETIVKSQCLQSEFLIKSSQLRTEINQLMRKQKAIDKLDD